jgi:hypothetical protein
VTVTELRLHRRNSGERGPDTTEREHAHRRVSRSADSKASSSWHWTGHERDGDHKTRSDRRWSMGGGGAPCTRGQSEREGERVG